jgi:hypothetical protein
MAITTETKMKNLYSERGFDYIVDDTAPSTTVVNQIIEDTLQTIRNYVGHLHADADIEASSYYQSRGTWIACHLLSQRRGNEHYFYDLYQIAVNELIAKSQGDLPPDPDVPLRFDLMPSAANLVVDDRTGVSKIRVIDDTSVGSVSTNRDSAYTYLFGWI